jgi:hypothetical protein
VRAERLRHLGLLTENESVERIVDGPWTRDGPYYVSIVQVYLKNGEQREFVLKSPWDVTAELMTGTGSKASGSELIREHVRNQMTLSEKIRRLGLPCIRIMAYDDGTMIQENIEGEPLQVALAKASESQARHLEDRSRRIIHDIETKMHLRYLPRAYAGARAVEASRDFLVRKSGELILVNLQFMPAQS